GTDISIGELAEKIKSLTGYAGEIVFDHSKPDGMARKLLDVSRLKNMGWSAKISLWDGLQRTYEEIKNEQWTT
ncbi:MAG TPA: hypothetical protein VI603_18580, partial [Saprospiraceae bacterium]|nr:hypothetical protein [Saprospiraceae bacterium]